MKSCLLIPTRLPISLLPRLPASHFLRDKSPSLSNTFFGGSFNNGCLRFLETVGCFFFSPLIMNDHLNKWINYPDWELFFSQCFEDIIAVSSTVFFPVAEYPGCLPSLYLRAIFKKNCLYGSRVAIPSLSMALLWLMEIMNLKNPHL